MEKEKEKESMVLFQVRLRPGDLEDITKDAQVWAEQLGYKGHAASVSAYVRQTILAGQSVVLLRDGISVPQEKQKGLLSEPFLRGAAAAAAAIYSQQ